MELCKIVRSALVNKILGDNIFLISSKQKLCVYIKSIFAVKIVAGNITKNSIFENLCNNLYDCEDQRENNVPDQKNA